MSETRPIGTKMMPTSVNTEITYKKDGMAAVRYVCPIISYIEYPITCSKVIIK